MRGRSFLHTDRRILDLARTPGSAVQIVAMELSHAESQVSRNPTRSKSQNVCEYTRVPVIHDS